MLAVRDAIPKARDLAKAEFATLRLRLLKIAARVVETASRVRLAFAAACPEAESCVKPLFAALFKPRAVMETRGSSAHQLVDSSIQLYFAATAFTGRSAFSGMTA